MKFLDLSKPIYTRTPAHGEFEVKILKLYQGDKACGVAELDGLGRKWLMSIDELYNKEDAYSEVKAQFNEIFSEAIQKLERLKIRG